MFWRSPDIRILQTQPTLTKFLQNLETELGQKLFRKLGHRFVLTYAGERYVAKATEILNLKKEMDQELNDIIKNNYGSLKIAFPTMRGTYMLPCTLPIFNSLYPNVHLDILESHSSQLEGMLLNGEADLAFFNLPVKSPDIDYEIICHEELRTQQTVDLLFKSCGITPIVKLQTSNIAAKVQLVAKGYGCGFVTETHLKHIQPPPNIVCFSVGTDTCTTVDFVAAYRRGSYLPYHAQEYIKIVKDFT